MRYLNKSILLCLAAFAIGDTASASSIYAPWSHGPSQDPNFFPISVWWQQPTMTGKSGAYPTQAAAAAGEGINIFLGIGQAWPEQFGHDNGELEVIKANNLYLIGGISTPSTENTSAGSVASMQSLANSIGASANLIGYNAGDEPNCAGMQAAPSVVQGIRSFDSTRIITYNHVTWMLNPEWESCLSADTAALQANGAASFDFYPLTNPWYPQIYHFPNGNFLRKHNDSLWIQGVAVQALGHFAAANQPLWAYVEAGGDNLGFSEQNNNFAGAVTSGSSMLSNVSGWSKFSAAWQGLKVSGPGIPANTTIAQIIDATHASMSSVATGTNASESVTVTGGAYDSDCVASFNICVAQGNEYRSTPVEINAEVWISIINGANGIEYFCDDTTSFSFCLGDAAGAAAAKTAQTNLTFINKTVLSYAPVLNAPTVGICSMDKETYQTGAITTAASCTNGVITMLTSNAAVPGMVLVKQLGSATYVIAQSGRQGTGAKFTYRLPSLGPKTATIVYDSAAHYHNTSATIGHTFALNSAGEFSDVLGKNSNDYQVKIYQIN